MQERHDTRGVGDENGNAVGNADGEGCPPLGGDVSIGLASSQPALPATGVNEHPATMDLAERNDAERRRCKLVLNRGPASHHLADGLGANQAERSSFARGRKRADPPTLEVGDYFLADLAHLY